VHDATTDAAQVGKWWAACPRANVGVACGAVLWALDADGEEGQAALAALCSRHGELPTSPTSRTGRGGRHVSFLADPRARNSVRKIASGLDTRGAGGYLAAPPSIHENGNRYAWLPGRDPWSVPLAPAPAWLLDQLDPPRPTMPAPGPAAILPGAADAFTSAPRSGASWKPWCWRGRGSGTTR
jgi:hypothetical protein